MRRLQLARRGAIAALLISVACSGPPLSGPLAFGVDQQFATLDNNQDDGEFPAPGGLAIYLVGLPGGLENSCSSLILLPISDGPPLFANYVVIGIGLDGGEIVPGTFPIVQSDGGVGAGGATVSYFNVGQGAAGGLGNGWNRGPGVGGSVVLRSAGATVAGSFTTTVLGQNLSGNFNADFCKVVPP